MFIHPDFIRDSVDFSMIERRQPHKVASLQDETYLLEEKLRLIRKNQFEQKKRLLSAQNQLKEITSSIQASIKLYIFQLNYFRQQGIKFLMFLLVMIDKLQNSDMKQQLSGMLCFYINEQDQMPTLKSELVRLVNQDIDQFTPVPFNRETI